MKLIQRIREDRPLKQLLEESVGSVEAHEGSILVLNENEDALSFALSLSPVADRLIKQSVGLHEGVTGLSLTLQQPMIVNDTSRSASYDDRISRAVGAPTKSIMVVPLVNSRTVFGALTAVNSKREGGFSTEDLEHYSEQAAAICQRLEELESTPDDAESTE